MKKILISFWREKYWMLSALCVLGLFEYHSIEYARVALVGLVFMFFRDGIVEAVKSANDGRD
jgi:hypothetical protein